jgi:hypothetical protein
MRRGTLAVIRWIGEGFAALIDAVIQRWRI